MLQSMLIAWERDLKLLFYLYFRKMPVQSILSHEVLNSRFLVVLGV